MKLDLHVLGFDLPSLSEVLRLVIQLSLAVLIGGVLGYEREKAGKDAGLRTHILVCLGSTYFVIAVKLAGGDSADSSRVIQGIAAGVGFIGAGSILKLSSQETILGLTTAATIWFTAALGVTIALDNIWVPVIGVVFALGVLRVLNSWGSSGNSVLVSADDVNKEKTSQ